jgi:hypothetical protein
MTNTTTLTMNTDLLQETQIALNTRFIDLALKAK